jgi:hypothetical protein
MFSARDPLLHSQSELVGRHPSVRYGYDFKHAFATGRRDPCHIAL